VPAVDAPPAVSPEHNPHGLRERKKERTREALIDAAEALFAAKGYDATTVDEVVAEVEVSRRTFFRYFSGKEEVALARGVEVEQRIGAAVSARPAGEAPLTALRRSVAEVICEVSVDAAGSPSEGYLRTRRLIEANPVLLAASLRSALESERRLVVEIARRQGVDPAADPRPALVVHLFHAVMRTALDRWAERGEAGADVLIDLMDEAWRRLATLGAEGWTGDAEEAARVGETPRPTAVTGDERSGND
jgi:AcrR family transcriptional regulator